MKTDSEGTLSLTLKTIMDLTEAEGLRLSFLDGLSAAKTINILAGDVGRITTPCIQVLYAMKIWATHQDIDFLVSEISDPFQSALDDVGLGDEFSGLEQNNE